MKKDNKKIKWYDISDLNIVALADKGSDLLHHAKNLSHWIEKKSKSGMPDEMLDTFSLRCVEMIRRSEELRYEMVEKVFKKYPELNECNLRFADNFDKVATFKDDEQPKLRKKLTEEHDDFADSVSRSIKEDEDMSDELKQALRQASKMKKASA